MRLVGSTKQLALVETLSKRFSDKHIEFLVESEENLDWGSDEYGVITWHIWVKNEHEFPVAKLLFLQMIQGDCPDTIPPPRVPETPQQNPQKKKCFLPPVCMLFLCICCSLFILDILLPNNATKSPLAQELLFDYPKALEEKQIGTMQKTMPFFPGMLPLLEATDWNVAASIYLMHKLPKIERIYQGQLWRLVTPSFMHYDFLHLLFNMSWLILLGPVLEKTMRSFPFLGFSLSAAICSNVAQYCMSGFNFLGFSGIISSYGGYIFRQSKTSSASSFAHLYEQTRFLFWMILFFALCSIIELILSFYTSFRLPFSFANTAHVVGFTFGYFWSYITNQLRNS